MAPEGTWWCDERQFDSREDAEVYARKLDPQPAITFVPLGKPTDLGSPNAPLVLGLAVGLAVGLLVGTYASSDSPDSGTLDSRYAAGRDDERARTWSECLKHREEPGTIAEVCTELLGARWRR